MTENKVEATVCNTCKRNHSEYQPCPKRITRALLGRPGAINRLSPADLMWISKSTFNVAETVEELLADQM
uniref:Uncharacterized protein n=1 Tax=viral metagenome TaxID=1070528 RepID=A0A6M3K657_9ZZZZ